MLYRLHLSEDTVGRRVQCMQHLDSFENKAWQ